jgi:predicted metal-dependent hydrolase
MTAYINNDVYTSHFFTALSTMFPDGELFFVEAVRAVRDLVKTPELKEDIKRFIKQEAMHRKEHTKFNKMWWELGYRTDKLEAATRALLGLSKKLKLSNKSNLAITVGLEHFTATLSAMFLSTAELRDGLDDKYKDLWLWHTSEEIDHKSVAFEVYQEIFGDDSNVSAYLYRVLYMTLVTIAILIAVHKYTYTLLKDDNTNTVLTILKGLNKTWGVNGYISKLIPDILDYYRPGFHPADHDHRELLIKYFKG